jgi:thioredoxin
MPANITTCRVMEIPTLDLPAFDSLSRSPGLTVLDFTAAWCSPCKTMGAVLGVLAAELGPRVRFAAIDVDQEPALAERFLVRSMPTVVLWRDGREVGRIVGARPRAFVAGVIDRALAGDVAIAAP